MLKLLFVAFLATFVTAEPELSNEQLGQADTRVRMLCLYIARTLAAEDSDELNAVLENSVHDKE